MINTKNTIQTPNKWYFSLTGSPLSLFTLTVGQAIDINQSCLGRFLIDQSRSLIMHPELNVSTCDESNPSDFVVRPISFQLNDDSSCGLELDI